MSIVRFQLARPIEPRVPLRTVVLSGDDGTAPGHGDWDFWESLFPEDRWDEVYTGARAAADQWYRAPDVADLLSVHDVPLAGAVQWDVFCFMLQVLRDLLVLETLAARDAPTSLLLPRVEPHWNTERYDPGLTCALAERWAQARGLGVQWDDAAAAPPSSLVAPARTSLIRACLASLPDRPRRRRSPRPCVLVSQPVLDRLGLSVPRLLHERGYEIVVADRGPQPEPPLTESTRARSWGRFTTTNLRRVHLQAQRRLEEALRRIAWPSVCREAGVPAAAEPLFADYVRGLCRQRLPLQAEYVCRTRDLAAACDLRAAVFCYTWSGYERLMAETLRQVAVPTVTLAHGLLVQAEGCLPIVTDYVGTLGDADKELLVAAGIAEDRIRSVGCPRFDEVATYANASPRQSVPPTSKTVLLVTQAHSAGVQSGIGFIPTRRCVHVVREALAGQQDLRLVVRLHPADNITASEKAAWAAQGIGLAEPGHLYEWLAAADIVVNQSSTVGLEALFFDKPLVVMNLSRKSDPVPYMQQGVALEVYEPADLLPAIRQALAHHPHTPATRERFIRHYACAVDGKSAERAADLVEYAASRGAV